MEIQQIETSELADKQQQLTIFYDSLDEDTANYLKAKEYRIVQIGNSYLTELGKEFKEAQDRLASHNKNTGCFGKWIEALGIKERTVYNWINRYAYVLQNLQNITEVEEFESLPKTVSYELSSPKGNPQIKEAIRNKEITNSTELKEYKAKIEAEAKAKYEAELAEKDKLLQQEKHHQQMLNQRINNINYNLIEEQKVKDKYLTELAEKDKQIKKLKAEVKTEIIYEESPELQKALWEAQQEKERLKNETEKHNRIIKELQEQLKDIKLVQGERDELESQIASYKLQKHQLMQQSDEYNIEMNAIGVIKELVNNLDIFLSKNAVEITLQRVEQNKYIYESKLELQKRIKLLYKWIINLTERMEISYE